MTQDTNPSVVKIQQIPKRLQVAFAAQSVRTKTLLITLFIGAILFIVVFFPLRAILLNGFTVLEEQLITQNTWQAKNALMNDLLAIDRIASNFSDWDDTYEFMTTQNQDYIDTNYPDTMFIDSQVNLVILFDSNGSALFQREYDFSQRHDIPIDQTIFAKLEKLATSQEEHLGLLVVPKTSLLISIRPILTSDSQGPARGNLLIGSLLDEAKIAQLERDLQLSIDLLPINDPQVPADLQHADPTSEQRILSQTDGESLIHGYTLLRDVNEEPSFILRTTRSRDIYARGQLELWYLSATLFGIILTVALLLIFLLERTVLSRLLRLAADVEQIEQRGDAALRVQTSGNDEIAQVGQAINTMLDTLNITEQSRLQAEKETIKAKTDFVTSVSHELRTPLTPILGFTDLMLMNTEGPLTPQQRTSLETIKRHALRMEELLNDLLEIGRLDTEHLNLNLTQVNMSHIATVAVELLRTEAMKRGIIIEIEAEQALPSILADQRRVEQILLNLVSNAIKYTRPGGRIWLRVYHPQPNMIAVDVEDTGVGLTEEQIKHIFTRFYRAKHQILQETRGTGLGLAITKSLVELHHGQISVQSTPDVGSTFTVHLPIQPPQ